MASDIERIELAIRRVLATATGARVDEMLYALADELARMRPVRDVYDDHIKPLSQEPLPGGPKINWVP